MMFYKETDFRDSPIGRVPKDWEISRLGVITENVKGRKPARLLDEKSENSLPYLKAEYMRSNSNVKWCERDDPNIVKVNDSDLIMIWDGSYSGDVFTGFEGALASTMVRIIPEEKLSANFLYYFLSTKFEFLRGTTSGTGVPHVSKGIYENLLIPLPSLVEQRAVVGVLGVVDSAIGLVDEVIAKTERLKKGLMQELLTKGIGHKEYKDTPIGKTPKTWHTLKIGNIAELKSGGTPYRERPEYWQNGDIPWIKSGELNDGEIYSSQEKISELGLENSSAKVFQKGTLLMALYGKGTVSKTAILGIDSATNQAICAFLPKDRQIDPKFLQYYLIFARNRLLGQLANPSSDVGRTNIYLNMLESFRISLPEKIEEQKKISEILSAVDKKLELERAERMRLERIKRGLMDLFLTGKVRVKVD